MVTTSPDTKLTEVTRAEAVVAAAIQLFRDTSIKPADGDNIVDELRAIALSPSRLVVGRAAPQLIEIAAAMIVVPSLRMLGFEIIGVTTLAMTEIKLVDIFGEEGWRLARPIELLLTTLAPVWPLVCQPETDEMMMDLSMAIILVARVSAFFGYAPVTLAIDKEVWVPRLTAFLDVVPQNEHRKELEECMAVMDQAIEVTRKTLQDCKDRGETEKLEGLMRMHNECQSAFEAYLAKMRETLEEIKRRIKEKKDQLGSNDTPTDT